ncbi:LOW QUALITY PROTEIN: uncharacterized protein ACOB7L_008033 [Callospermophilus lateralis]
MERGNQTGNFILLGFTDDPDLQSLFFGLLLAMYLVTVLGNLLIILAVISDSHLHTPMYFFLSNLSLADIGFTSTTIPKALRNIQTHSKGITFSSCISQIYFFVLFGCQDNLLLTVMAYDRFVAICHPLHYVDNMSPWLCLLMALGSWFLSVLGALPGTLTILRLSFCTKIEIPHFFCDLPEILKLACSDTLINNIVVYTVTIILGVFPLTGILFSYSQIFSSILRISSDRGKYKAFSTCGSHLLVVSLFYGTGLGVYLSSVATLSSRIALMASVMYTMVTPMLNPFIYSLRNRDIKVALGRVLSKMVPLSERINMSVSVDTQSKVIDGKVTAPTGQHFVAPSQVAAIQTHGHHDGHRSPTAYSAMMSGHVDIRLFQRKWRVTDGNTGSDMPWTPVITEAECFHNGVCDWRAREASRVTQSKKPEASEPGRPMVQQPVQEERRQDPEGCWGQCQSLEAPETGVRCPAAAAGENMPVPEGRTSRELPLVLSSCSVQGQTASVSTINFHMDFHKETFSETPSITWNQRISQFLLLGLAEDPELQPLIFGLFLSMCLANVLGNLLIILATISDSHLHTPMYFFLSNLSFVDICFTSTTVPKMLVNIQTQSKATTKGITFVGCISQVYFFVLFGCQDNLLLTVMAYDRFLAICHPLHYVVIMKSQLCLLMALGSWLVSVLGSLPETLTVLRLSFCTKLKIPHFFCDLPEVLKLACSDTLINNIVVYTVTIVLGVFPLSGILLSYSQIFSSILRISSAEGKYKAFSTCGSHLLVVSLFYGTGLGVYLSSAAAPSSRMSLMASVLYTMLTPMLNPFIYSLRNRDIKVALGRVLSKMVPLN